MNIIKCYAKYLVRYLRGTRGVAAMEYAIIVGVIVVGIGAAVATFQDEITGMITDVTNDLVQSRKDIKTNQKVGP